jgi:uncharacterized protein YhfF
MLETNQAFWQEFKNAHPEVTVNEYTAWSFGNTPEMADELGALVLNGEKRATTSLLWIYEKFPEEKIPLEGAYSIVLNAAKEPLCVIKSTSVTTRKYSEVDEEYARIEGEGDKSLRYWDDVHWKYFVGECKLVGREPSKDMPVVCEIFEVVYANPRFK